MITKQSKLISLDLKLVRKGARVGMFKERSRYRLILLSSIKTLTKNLKLRLILSKNQMTNLTTNT